MKKSDDRCYCSCAAKAACIVIVVVLGAAVIWLSVSCPKLGSCLATANEGGAPEQQAGNFFTPPEGFAQENVLQISGNTLIIGRDCLAIIADTSQERADAIAGGLSNLTPSRPASYDGWASTLDAFGIRLEAVTLYGFQEDYYLSRAYFSRGSSVLDLDIKPSDAIALAVRTKSPIYLNMSLLAANGQNIC